MGRQPHVFGRARAAALHGLAAQSAMAAALYAIGQWQGTVAATYAAYFAIVGVPVWACMWLVYTYLTLECAAERAVADTAGAPAGDGARTAAIAGRLAAARARVRLARAAGFAVTSVLTAAYLLSLGVYIFWFRPPAPEAALAAADPLAALALTTGLAFVGLVVGRYLVGLTTVPEWRLLRAAATYLMASILLAFAAAAGFALAHFGFPSPLRYLATAVPVVALAVGAETALSLFLGFFRPRAPGALPRPAFDSRMLGLLSAPEGVGKAVADTLNYQFGFEVSRNWFLQLLGRAVWPLVGLSVGSLLLLSCFVVVEPHQQALVTRFGRIVGKPRGPGLRLKAPWPIDSARLYDVRGVRKIHIGSHKPAEPGGEILKAGTPVLWSNIHAVLPEQLMVVAPPKHLSAAADGQPRDPRVRGDHAGKGPSVSLIGGDIFVEFRIGDLLDYVAHDVDAARRFAQIAEREALKELFRFDVDTLISTGRMSASAVLRERIQEASDRAGLGIEVLLVGFAGIHPPQQVADAFHQTVAAQQERASAIEDAQQYAIMQLAQAAGTVRYAQHLAASIERLERTHAGEQAPGDAAARAERVESLLRAAGGMVAEKIADATAYRWWRENSERGKADRFEKQLLTMEAAPRVYRMSYYLSVLEQGLARARKYVIVGERDRLILRFDFKDSSASLRGASDAATRGGHP